MPTSRRSATTARPGPPLPSPACRSTRWSRSRPGPTRPSRSRLPSMTAVSVFVDDAIRGDLPMVCVKTGEPTDMLIRMQRPVGSDHLGAAALLFLLGPIGAVTFFLLMVLAPGREYLTVRLPETEAAYRRERELKRSRLAAFAAGVMAPVVG